MIARAITVEDHTWWWYVAFGWLVFFFVLYGPTIERIILPVISPFEIVQIEPDGVGSRVYVEFDKYRSCEYLGMNWSLIRPDGKKQRAFLNLKPIGDMSGSSRPRGEAVAGPWYVGLTPEQIKGHSSATIAYRCHPLWISEIEVWP